MPERTFPAPDTVSEAARTFLDRPPFPARPNPALDDTEGWLQVVQQTDAYILELASRAELPVESHATEIAGVPVYIARSEEVSDDSGPIYLDIHGGALLMGGGAVCEVTGRSTAATNGMQTWAVDYRMPPLHPYPAGLDDVLAVYRALLEAREPSAVIVGGASAGGNLAAALLLRASEEGLPMPAGLVLLTPEVDLTESGDTFRTLDGVDNVLGSLHDQNLLYAGGHPLEDPHLSPLFGDVSGFPPTLLQSGTRDLYLSNTVRMHRRLRAHGVPAFLHVWEAMPHGGFGGGTPEDIEVRREVRIFIDHVLGATTKESA